MAGVYSKYTSAGVTLSLNELGDFLAGAFAPLAFFWLVLGFFQQGRELNNSVLALNLQAEELSKTTVAAQESLAAQRSELRTNEIRRKQSIQPKFVISMQPLITHPDDSVYYALSIENEGEVARELKVSISLENDQPERLLRALFRRGDTLSSTRCEIAPDLVRCEFSYIDIDGEPHSGHMIFEKGEFTSTHCHAGNWNFKLIEEQLPKDKLSADFSDQHF